MNPSDAPASPAGAGWIARVRTWWADAAADFERVRQVTFEVQLGFSLVATATSAVSERFFLPGSVVAMRTLLLIWGALHPVFFLASRRAANPQRLYFAFLACALGILNLGFMNMQHVWLETTGVRVAYQGTVLLIALLLLQSRYSLPLLAVVAAFNVGVIQRSVHPLGPQPAEAVVVVLPVVISSFVLMFAGLLMERLRQRSREFQDQLAEQNARLEAEVSARAKIIERQQEQLLQAQKLEAVGTLAAGLAHDFNNLLAVILGYARELRLYAEPGDPVGKAADVIDSCSRRASDLTQRLLGFAQKGKVQDVPVDLHETVAGVLRLVERNLGAGIKVERELAADPAFVRGDPLQIQQVVVNLVLNARDAMPSGGTLTLATRLAEVRDPAEVAPGRYLVLEVRDTGHGVPQEIRSRVFDPFFTTKRQGAGTGLGLAMVYGIAREHGGEVSLKSEEGRGSTFRVLLPATDDRPSAPAASPPPPVPGRGVLVLVAPEQVVLGMSQRVRALLAAAARGEARDQDWLDAREFVRSHAGTFDLIVFDRGRQ